MSVEVRLQYRIAARTDLALLVRLEPGLCIVSEGDVLRDVYSGAELHPRLQYLFFQFLLRFCPQIHALPGGSGDVRGKGFRGSLFLCHLKFPP